MDRERASGRRFLSLASSGKNRGSYYAAGPQRSSYTVGLTLCGDARGQRRGTAPRPQTRWRAIARPTLVAVILAAWGSIVISA